MFPITERQLLAAKPLEINIPKIALLIGPGAQREAMLEFTAILALRGPVRVLDTGNRFDPYRVSRAIRRQTHLLDAALGRIFIARAFTCYQVITLLQQTPDSPEPKLIFDLPATFYDESVSYVESYRLLQIAAQSLLRLRRQGPVIVSARAVPEGERNGLIKLLRQTADLILLPEARAVSNLERLL